MTDDTPSKPCTKCGAIRPLTDFYPNRSSGSGLTSQCRNCLKASSTAWKALNAERALAYQVQWRQENKSRLRERYRDIKRAAYLANRESRLDGMRRRHAENRAAAFAHYGENCACCGSAKKLQIDHIKGGGQAHKLEIFGYHPSAQMFYIWLKRNNFPDGFQTLCGPCNRSKKDSAHCRLHH